MIEPRDELSMIQDVSEVFRGLRRLMADVLKPEGAESQHACALGHNGCPADSRETKEKP